MDPVTLVTALSESMGDSAAGVTLGLLTGAGFGFAAQRSALCLRSAAVETGRGRAGPALAVWLLAFAATMVLVQGAELAGLFRSDAARLMGVTGSISGAVIGGLVFGIGMVMARGCSGRLLVLAGTGNLRAIVAGLFFALTAQVTLSGVLAPARLWLARLWVTPDDRNASLSALLGLPRWSGLALGIAVALAALGLARRSGADVRRMAWAGGAALAVAFGWVASYTLAQVSFEPVNVGSASFAAPSADALMLLLSRMVALDFEVALVPGAFLGAFLGGLWGRELRIESYSGTGQLARSVGGGALMGFGGVLAAGCAIGAGLSGASILMLTAWIATAFFFVGAFIGDRVLDHRAAGAHAPVAVAQN